MLGDWSSRGPLEFRQLVLTLYPGEEARFGGNVRGEIRILLRSVRIYPGVVCLGELPLWFGRICETVGR